MASGNIQLPRVTNLSFYVPFSVYISCTFQALFPNSPDLNVLLLLLLLLSHYQLHLRIFASLEFSMDHDLCLLFSCRQRDSVSSYISSIHPYGRPGLYQDHNITLYQTFSS